MQHALLLVDLQNDFCPGGALPIIDGDKTIQIANQVLDIFQQQQLLTIASLDWHPINHQSFANVSGTQVGEVGLLHGLTQVWWPKHCIQHSVGAAFHPDLNQHLINQIILKGQSAEVDSYSAFFDNGRRQQTRLHGYLQLNHVQKLTIMGLATDYCVKYTVLDALSLGYQVNVLVDGCRGVNLAADDSQKALQEMSLMGAKLINLDQFAADNN